MITRTFDSSSSSAKYVAHYDPATGASSCNCRGWTIKKLGQARGCTHTRQLGATGVPVTPPVTTPPPAGTLTKPMLASARTVHPFAYYENPAWVLETKHDGIRLLVRKAGLDVTAWTRTGNSHPLTPAMVTEVRTLPDGLYDGEFTGSGGKSWHAQRGTTAKVLVLFDVLEVYGVRVMDRPYTERRELLIKAAVHVPAPATTLTVSLAVPVTQAAVDAIWEEGLEGAILKRTAATYQPGHRSDSWIKIKREGSAVVTITGFAAGKSGPYSRLEITTAEGRVTTIKTLGNALLAAIAANPQKILGRRAVLLYTELTDTGAFRHPRFDHWAGPAE